jgi:iron complex outermembrane receptor protein
MDDRNSRIGSTARAIALACAALPATPAFAQAPAQRAPQAAALDEIVVTARKREERLQDVPLVVDAYGSEEIRRRGMQDLADVALATPGLQFDSYNSGLASPVIRGAAQQNINNLEQNVSSFFDGLYLARGYVTDLGLVDVERVEVIKGPQSARYGRNAFMGAINYVPARPTDALTANAAVTYGSDERREASAALGGPIVPGLLSGRISYGWREFDGTVPNSSRFPRGPKPGNRGNLGGTEREQYSAALRLTPVEQLTVDAAYYAFDIRDESTPTYLFGNLGGAQPFVATNCGQRVAGEFRLYCGELPERDAVDVDSRSYGRQADVDVVRGGLAWQQDAFSVNYVYGRVKADTAQVGFSDTNTVTCPYFNPSPTCVFQNVPNGGIDYESHEVRLGYELAGRFRATVGYYYSDGDDRNVFTIGFLPALASNPTAALPSVGGPWQLLSDVTTLTVDRSWFAEVGVGLLDDRLRLSAELRRGEERKTQTNNVNGVRLSDTFESTTPRFTAEYRLTPANLLYASAAKGIRTGGFNVNAFLPANRTYAPEQNWTYELGSKNELLDDRLVLNATLFYVSAQDTQVSARDPGNPSPTAIQILLNVGSFTSQGVELQATARVAEPLTLRAALTYTDAEYDSGTVDFRYTAVCDDVVCPRSGSIAGRTLQRQSPWSASAAADWQAPLAMGADLEYFLRADVSYQGKQYVDQMNLAWVAARTLVNASVGVAAARWEVRLWARNLLDERYLSQSFFTPGASTSYAPVIGEGRNYGATLTARF